MSMDITCAHCQEPWEVYGLRHEGTDYLHDGPTQATQLGVADLYTIACEGDLDARAKVSHAVYVAVLSGKGCPLDVCGFDHGSTVGPYREQQMIELVFDGVTDDDPMLFL